MSSTFPSVSGTQLAALGLLGCTSNSADEDEMTPAPKPASQVAAETPEPPAEACLVRPKSSANGNCSLHRVAKVRAQQGITERTIARRLGIDVKQYRLLEDPTRDLKLSELLALQVALDVPLIDLLEDRQELSRPVEERAKMVKIMKTAVALRDTKSNSRIERLTQMLCDQLIDLMPELAEVNGWPQFGARRGPATIGRALSQPIDTSHLRLPE